MSFSIGLNSLQVKKVVLHTLFLIIMQKYKNQNHYYYNIFLQKVGKEIFNRYYNRVIYQSPKNNDNKQVFCINCKYCIMIELKELMLIRQKLKEHDICHYWYFLDKG